MLEEPLVQLSFMTQLIQSDMQKIFWSPSLKN